MIIYGLDFTSAPHLRKPITYARCRFVKDRLSLESLGSLTSFAEFEDFLRRPGPWVAGMDFPFGQPRKLIENLGWPSAWDAAIRQISRMSKVEFIHALETYCQGRAKGDKHHLRLTDRLARARSPMMLYRVPVGRMFFEGAPRLLAAGVSVYPCCMQNDSRLCLEAYPALVARRWIGSSSYKTDTPTKRSDEMRTNREKIVHWLRCGEAKAYFGLDVQINDRDADLLILDGSGDFLDAMLCAIQAGWAYSQRDRNFGIPEDCDPLEGWIVDPLLVKK
jgi:hypothetical protein